jgi:SanA protein
MFNMTFRFLVAFASLLVVLSVGAWLWVSYLAHDYVVNDLKDVQHCKAALILGTSPLARSGKPNIYFVYRMNAAATLFLNGKADYLIVSGARSSANYDEPSAMRAALVARGVPADRIYRDEGGDHTLESVMRAKNVYGLEDAIIVSQRFHIERAIYLARAHGLSFTGFAAQDVTFPSGLLMAAREVISRLGAVYYGLTEPLALAKNTPVTLGTDPPT